VTTFDLDEFIEACRAAVAAPEPTSTVKELLTAAVRGPARVAAELPATRAELSVLYASSELTIMKAVWTPAMTLPPHNHRMWGAIGVYGGVEENHFFRRASGGGIEPSGGKDLAAGQVALLGRDTIHAVTNPRTHEFTAAIHVYGGDFMHEPRSVWPGEPPVETPATGETMQGYFERANEASAEEDAGQ
jgi:predicted metal-dependent enzyme (double-stranded beta helix superfamily)